MAEVFLGGSKPLRFLSHFVLGVEFFSQKFGVILCFLGGRLFIKAFWKFGIEFSRPPKSLEDPFHPTCDWQSSWTIENCQIILGVLVRFQMLSSFCKEASDTNHQPIQVRAAATEWLQRHREICPRRCIHRELDAMRKDNYLKRVSVSYQPRKARREWSIIAMFSHLNFQCNVCNRFRVTSIFV